MSDFSDVVKFLSSLNDLKHGTGAKEQDIAYIVSAWGNLPEDFEEFLKKYGWVKFDSFELLGAGPAVPSHLDLLTWARGRWSAGLDNRLLPIYNPGADWFYCMDPEGRVVCVDFDGSIDIEDHLSWSDWFIQKFGTRH